MNSRDIKKLKDHRVYPIKKDRIKALILKEEKEQHKFRLIRKQK